MSKEKQVTGEGNSIYLPHTVEELTQGNEYYVN